MKNSKLEHTKLRKVCPIIKELLKGVIGDDLHLFKNLKNYTNLSSHYVMIYKFQIMEDIQ